jgi:hypothetical protein
VKVEIVAIWEGMLWEVTYERVYIISGTGAAICTGVVVA